jgi:alkylation response protein AidB-like acyl-CoA dehydrogenase
MQTAVTEVAAQIDVADLLLQRCIDRSTRPDEFDYQSRLECRRDATYAVRVLVRAIDSLQQLGGARGLAKSNPLQRAWRDVHSVAAHVVMNFQAAGESFGRLEFGLDPPERDPYF